MVSFLIQSVDIIVERIVLLFSLNEGSHDFFNRLDSSLLPDLIEGILNDLDISHVLVNQLPLLNISCCDLCKSSLQDCDWVAELNCPLLTADGSSKLLLFLFIIFSLILFSEFVLNILNFFFKLDLLSFMFGFEREDLIVCFFSALLTLLVFLVVGFCVLFALFDLPLGPLHFVFRS